MNKDFKVMNKTKPVPQEGTTNDDNDTTTDTK
jgi:hypothetical protein